VRSPSSPILPSGGLSAAVIAAKNKAILSNASLNYNHQLQVPHSHYSMPHSKQQQHSDNNISYDHEFMHYASILQQRNSMNFNDSRLSTSTSTYSLNSTSSTTSATSLMLEQLRNNLAMYLSEEDDEFSSSASYNTTGSSSVSSSSPTNSLICVFCTQERLDAIPDDFLHKNSVYMKPIWFTQHSFSSSSGGYPSNRNSKRWSSSSCGSASSASSSSIPSTASLPHCHMAIFILDSNFFTHSALVQELHCFLLAQQESYPDRHLFILQEEDKSSAPLATLPMSSSPLIPFNLLKPYLFKCSSVNNTLEEILASAQDDDAQVYY